MGDFPEKITMQGDISFNPNQSPNPKNPFGCKVAQQEYVRSDLVPQWLPIDTLTTNERVIVLFDNDHIDSGWLDNIDERRFFRTGHGKLPLTRLTHWMPIPKVQE